MHGFISNQDTSSVVLVLRTLVYPNIHLDPYTSLYSMLAIPLRHFTINTSDQTRENTPYGTIHVHPSLPTNQRPRNRIKYH